VRTNKVLRVIYGPPQGDLVLYRFIYMYIANSLEKSSSHEPLTRMLFKLAWRFKFVQMKCPGSQMSPPQKGAKIGIFLKIIFCTSSYIKAKIFGMDHPNDM